MNGAIMEWDVGYICGRNLNSMLEPKVILAIMFVAVDVKTIAAAIGTLSRDSFAVFEQCSC